MDKAKKTRLKKIIALVCVGLVVILLAAMPLIAKNNTESDGPKASILSGTVQTGNINTTLIGGGALAEEEADAISVPTAVKLTKYLVSNGDSVKEGDPIAAVDRVTVMTAIQQVQETLDYLAEEIENESDKTNDGSVTALAGGTVKILYAEKDMSVQDVMLQHGALAVLSLDGLMAADLETDTQLTVGTQVTVTFAGGKTAEGKVETNLAGKLTVTLEDDNYAVGEPVDIATEDGTIGSAQLYIYSPWNATAYDGTVSSVKVSVGEKVSAGETLLKLTGTGHTATYQQLVGQRQEYEELMLDLFKMYQTEHLVAPCDGVVSGVDKDSLQLLSEEDGSYSLSLLANAPNGDDQTQYINYVGQVSAVGQNGWALQMNPQSIPIADYTDLSHVPLDEAMMTEVTLYDPMQANGAAVPVYEFVNGSWTQLAAADVASGDVLLFAGDQNGNFIWIVRIKTGATTPSAPNGTDTTPSSPTDPDTTPSSPTVPDTTPSSPTMPDYSYPSGGGYPQTEQESAFALYGLDMVDVAAVTPQATMTLDISIDELDISALKVGMEAQIMVDALGGAKFDAIITSIGNTGTNNGGNSKYTVQLTLDRGENMLSGMTATATIILGTNSDVLTIPASALVENGTKTVVYTGYDKKKDVLINPVEVTVGISDGENAQILEGLQEGATYYYAYYDTLEISATPDFGFSFRFGR